MRMEAESENVFGDANIIALEALLQTKSEKDLPDMRSEGLEPMM